MKIKYLPVIIIISFLFSCALPQTAVQKNQKEFNLSDSFVIFYRKGLNHLSAVRRGHCPMYPSCSSYSLEAIKKHGFFMGWIMTCDRLMRCGRDETKLSTSIQTENGSWHYYDPVENNDFWW
ncbi:conserved exported hypothetical protein [Candidatus Magnetomoraceae bacterium gMMP-15]